ncbi:MAG: BAX inhibitor protein [Gammaproteobacteria bacterium RIFCSPLOWO2_02_FULL_42_14]|nr:MAG: BAX inhibitor protein [Gammaproteobacteria bacterium RIFCSPHIGHO2_02_FULL_42_43]OGT28346.1 MAG: BAX inhibitor protein [Gammaproteobacteria bacterium RIFCSPHIGHO2_01_FULL_42_8]OGT53044.1 MAG: BAX inhibitor protein [Gammaproteobacteria bacterium RIFCSPHIGHO2_12_FULL_41_25]OGT61182.1 MAG: BAX inhibitor protein [Gammaproteobacteria bacterium RIFCSPLOWO2_02_FULL_42_14]OGT87109.1 MAG: BAX inhibitor protein [Gammaproteobacteria bacterium RIFCSPLOWO2_12_FULL_42_18]
MFNLKPAQNQAAAVRPNYQSTIATHEVLRKTYFLLSLTLLFSAAMAAVSMETGFALNWIVQLVGMFGLLFLTMWLRNSMWGVASMFAFTGFMGLTLGPTLNAYIAEFSNGPQLILTSLGATGIIFVALSAYVLTTKKDFSFLGGFLFIVLLGGILLSLAAVLFNIPMLQIAMSAVFVVVFSGFILYDTSRILNNGETNYVMATVSLYLDILNLFLSLLRILSYFGGNKN